MLEHSPKIIAVAGKGGVGKTSISAAFVPLLTEAYPDKRILAIDADPAVGLSTALGVEVRDAGRHPQEHRRLCGGRCAPGGHRAVERGPIPHFRHHGGAARLLLSGHRPAGDGGCYWKVNAYLKEVINLLANDFDYVVIDGEAGIEQINRRVMEKVTHLVLITDPSRKGTQVIETIKRVADELVMYDRCALSSTG